MCACVAACVTLLRLFSHQPKHLEARSQAVRSVMDEPVPGVVKLCVASVTQNILSKSPEQIERPCTPGYLDGYWHMETNGTNGKHVQGWTPAVPAGTVSIYTTFKFCISNKSCFLMDEYSLSWLSYDLWIFTWRLTSIGVLCTRQRMTLPVIRTPCEDSYC